MLIDLLSLAKTCFTVIAIFSTLFLIKFVLLPLKRMSELKRPDASFYFFPGIGFNRYMRKDLKTKGDFLYSVKHYKESHPNQKFEVTNMGSSATIMLRDPEFIREFVNKPALYEKHHLFRTIKLLSGTGLAMAEGDVWKAHRKIVSSCFNYEFLTSNTQNMMRIINEFLDKIPPQGERNFPAVMKMQEITGDVIGRLFFGEKLSSYTFKGKSLTVALAELVSQLGLCAVSLGVLLFGPKIMKMPFLPRYQRVMQDVTDFRKLCFGIIQDRKANPQKSINKDLLATLLEAQQQSGQSLSDEDIVNEFITFYLAGMDTTANVVAMVLYNLSQYPEYLETLKEERDRTYNTETIKTTETLQKMNQLHAFIKETMRFYSPAPGITFRVANADHKLLDLDIKKGDVVRADLFTSYFNEKYFDHPFEFNPKRFYDESNQKLDSHVFIPFSAGPRNCIGQHMATIEAKLIISEFLEKFEFKLREGYQLKMINRFTYEPEEKIFFDVKRKGAG